MALTAMLAAHAQTGSGGANFMLVSGSASAANRTSHAGEIVREIDDPHTGIRWLLMRDTSHPAGPGLLAPLAARETVAHSSETATLAAHVPAQPLVRAGDRLIVEEKTQVFEARLDAVALSPGRIGDRIAVRLTLGGRVARALVTEPGRATLQRAAEVWR